MSFIRGSHGRFYLIEEQQHTPVLKVIRSTNLVLDPRTLTPFPSRSYEDQLMDYFSGREIQHYDWSNRVSENYPATRMQASEADCQRLARALLLERL